jgi:hypothetical protein
MANEIPDSSQYRGLSRKVLQYSERFVQVVNTLKQRPLTASDWAPLEELVDTQSFRRVGVFLTPAVETSNWQQYQGFIAQYGGYTSWEGTLRRITEVTGLVFLELEERNTMKGVVDIANTVTIYRFNDAARLVHLDVYVAHIGQRPAKL